MASERDVDTSRTSLTTYVPAYQKDEWERHADQLDMSLSEFVRTMVQSGRRGFASDAGASTGNTRESATESGDGDSPDKAHQWADLEDRVVAVLADAGPLSWDELLGAVTGDIESSLEDALTNLQSANRVTHSGRAGGYVLEER